MKVFSTFAAILGILHGSNGYVLDKSCEPYKEMVINGMSSAFDMAQAGSDTLTQLSTSGSGAVWDAQKDLISYLFPAALTNGNIDKSSTNWGKVSNTFSAVLKYNNNQGQPQSTPSDYRSLSSDSVVVYCDYSRFTENKDCDGNKKKGYVCDTNLGISWPMNSLYSDCKSTSKLSTVSVEAWTFEFASLGLNRASEIQLCPGFLKTVQNNKVQNLKNQGRSLARGVRKLSSWLDDPFRTAMDVKYTFDATLLHEMTHAIPNAATEDSEGKNSYGWKNCVKMSGIKSITNADSYAFFGLAARMISPSSGTVAQRPMSDGSVNVLPGTSSKRDDAKAKEGAFIGHRAADQDFTVTIDEEIVTLSASNATGFVVFVPSSAPVTVSRGKEYTIGTDIVSLGSSDLVIDHSTLPNFPVLASTAISQASMDIVSSSQTASVQSRPPSTLQTTHRSSSSTSAVISSSTATSLSSSAVRATTSKASSSHINPSSSVISTGPSTTSSASAAISSTTSKTSSHTNPSSAAVSTGRSSGTAPTPSDSVSSQSTPSTGQTSIGIATSTSVSTNPTFTALRSTTSKALSHTSSSSAVISTGKSSATKSNSSGSISFASQGTTSGGSTSTSSPSSTSSTSTGVPKTTSKDLSPTNPSSTLVSTGQGSATLGTITQSSSTTVVPITVINVSKSGTTSPVTYISTYTSSGSIKPTGAWMCTGPLCNTGSSCIVPLFCSSSSGSSSSWGLCCGWEPPVTDGGSTPAAGGPSPGPPSDDDLKPTETQKSGSQTSTRQTTSTSSSSSCSTQTTSACDTSYSVFTPSGATTASTSTFTLSCSTVTGCSVSISASVTTTTGNQVISATPIGDAFNEFDTSATSWYELQQSIFAEASADTTGPYITWSASSISVDSSSSSGVMMTTTPASTATSAQTSSSVAVQSSSFTTSASPSSTVTVTTPTSTTMPSSSATTASATSTRSASSTAVLPTSASSSAAPICSEGNNSLMGVNNDPASWCFCGGRGPFATIPSATTSYCDFSTLPTQTISLTSISTSIATACSITTGTFTIPGSASTTVDTYCQCGDTMAGIGTTTSGSVVLAGCEIATPWPIVSTVSTIPPPPYQTGTCDLHVFEASENYAAPLYVQLNITDGANNLLASQNFQMKWGDNATVSASDSKLPYDIDVDFLRSTSLSSKKRRMVGPPPTNTVHWEDWILAISAGGTSWTDKETDSSNLPYCSVGGWDNGNFWDWLDNVITLGDDEYLPNRQMDCHWAC